MLLADSLRLLLEHGLLDGGKPVSYTIGCFPAWRNWGKGHIFKSSEECAAWKVVKHYYNLKVGGREREREREIPFIFSSQNGKEYTSKPEQLLCSSFAIPLGTDSSMKKVIDTGSYHYRPIYTYYSLSVSFSRLFFLPFIELTMPTPVVTMDYMIQNGVL